MNQFKPAIVAVGYNRPKCMKRLLDSIGRAEIMEKDVTLIVSIDESSKSDLVQQVAEEFEWKYGDKIIRRFPERQGLKKHIISCGDLSEKYGAVIILEDDLVVSPGFYDYVCQAQEYYADDDKVAGISLYGYSENVFSRFRFMPEKNQYDTYFGQYIVTWGESWSHKQWDKYKKWFEKNDGNLPLINDQMPREILEWERSWGKYFISYMVEKDMYYVIPYTPLSTNFSEKGEHRSSDFYETAYQVRLMACAMEYRFPRFSDGIKYDCFFERIPDKYFSIKEVDNCDLCIDLNGTRTSTLGKKYLLTYKKYELPLIRTYGLRMKPIEDNVIYNVEGKGIYLYRIDREIDLIPKSKKRRPYDVDVERIRYEVSCSPWRQILPYTVRLLKEAVLGKIIK